MRTPPSRVDLDVSDDVGVGVDELVRKNAVGIGAGGVDGGVAQGEPDVPVAPAFAVDPDEPFAPEVVIVAPSMSRVSAPAMPEPT